jgi:hypothetical protein
MAIDTYIAESTLLRVQKLVAMKGEEACADQIDMLRVYLTNAVDRVNVNGRTAVNNMLEGDEQRLLLLGIKRFTKAPLTNTKEARRRIAKTLCDAGKYCY